MFDLPEKITYWRKGGSDGVGGINWIGPVVTAARIAFKQERFTDANGNDSISRSVVYTNDVLVDGDFVFLGESSNLTPPPASQDVRAYSNTPSGAGDLRKLWL